MIDNKHLNQWQYVLFSAHIHKFLPKIPWTEHPKIYQFWFDYHRPKSLLATDVHEIPSVTDLGLLQPSIICLYHLGMHGSLPVQLAEAGLHFDILLDRSVYESALPEFRAMKARLDTNGRAYRFLISDDDQVLLQMRTTIRQGKHMLVFADGNSGTDKEATNKIQIDFLDGKLFVRQGIALISYLLKVPIISLAHRTGKNGQVLFADVPISPEILESRASYIYRSTQTLYSFLEKQVQPTPWMWECWGYLHEMGALDIKPGSVNEKLEFWDEDAIIPLILGDKSGYFDRINYRFFY